MKVQWLCIGGPAHGHIFDTEQTRARLYVRCGRDNHCYNGENYHFRGALFRVAFHYDTTPEQRYEVDRLIGEKQPRPVARDNPW